jgi:hypothetical protein
MSKLDELFTLIRYIGFKSTDNIIWDVIYTELQEYEHIYCNEWKPLAISTNTESNILALNLSNSNFNRYIHKQIYIYQYNKLNIISLLEIAYNIGKLYKCINKRNKYQVIYLTSNLDIIESYITHEDILYLDKYIDKTTVDSITELIL